ncbi:hypothetical protein QVD17_02289 [Tagetes erecta]|uniref:Uncharacterized protein n=1 Tax=Tagetes erecta TaxID=13708 RepID=A0AAD8L942_TARER|nr:hypothetical protein QVD17_02289 [Tagetes erecta]
MTFQGVLRYHSSIFLRIILIWSLINLSQKGSRNRSKHLYPSLHGSCSYAQRRHLQEKESGTSSHIETWRKAHCTKGGAWINPKAREDWAKIEQQYAQMELEAGETHVDEAECLVLALGKTRGHTRGVGRMVKRISCSESSGSSSSNRDIEMDAIKQQMFEMQERMKELEKRNKNPNDNEGGEDEDN